MGGYVPKNGTALIGLAGAGDTTAAGMALANFSLDSALTTTIGAQILAKGYVSAANNTILFGQNTIACASTDSVYALGATSTNYARLYYVGTEYMV